MIAGYSPGLRLPLSSDIHNRRVDLAQHERDTHRGRLSERERQTDRESVRDGGRGERRRESERAIE